LGEISSQPSQRARASALSTSLTLGQTVTITGPGASNLFISGGFSVGVFVVQAETTVQISGVTITAGRNGAGDRGETDRNGGNISNAVYAAELWSPTTQTWTTMASMHTPCEYHSTALLLPDRRVVESGMGSDFGNVPDEKSAEFYSPPYLFKGARPTISQAPSQISYSTNFSVSTPDAASIAQVRAHSQRRGDTLLRSEHPLRTPELHAGRRRFDRDRARLPGASGLLYAVPGKQ